jgi:transcriptional regulator with XRE-family HTH domain
VKKGTNIKQIIGITSMTKSLIEQDAEKSNTLRLLQQERLIIEVAHLICKSMEEKQIKRSQLAKVLGKSKSWVTQILHADANLTIRTIADIFTVMGKKLVLSDQNLLEDEKPLRCLTTMIGDYKTTIHLPYKYDEISSELSTEPSLVTGA